jgi:tetratricopeptide (TPR) repeat protein
LVDETRGLWDSAAAGLQESMRLGQDTGFLMAMTTIPIQLGLLWLRLGEVEEARRLHEEALAAGEETAPFILQAASAAIALDAFATGEVAKGLRWTRQAQAQEPLGDIATAFLLALPARAAIEAAAQQGDAEQWVVAHKEVESALAEARRRRLHVQELVLGHYRGLTLKGTGNIKAATEQWQETLDQAQRLNLRPHVLDVSTELFQLYRENGQTKEAERYRQLALVAMSELGDTLADKTQRHYFMEATEQRLTLG